MTILVTGSTGTVGSALVRELLARHMPVRALTRSPEKVAFPKPVEVVKGDLLDVDALRAGLVGVDALFLLVANVPDELTQALVALNLAREARVKGVVYLSVLRGDAFLDVPHFAAKDAVERMIAQSDMPATILRPAYYLQNDWRQKEALLGAGVYGMPVGRRGIAMVDVRDIAEAAACELVRRAGADAPLPRETYELAGPDSLTGPDLAAIWSEALDRPIRYGGDDLDGMETRMRAFAPAWLAYDMRQMMRRYQADGATTSEAEVARLTTLLGHPPRLYRAFAAEAAAAFAG